MRKAIARQHLALGDLAAGTVVVKDSDAVALWQLGVSRPYPDQPAVRGRASGRIPGVVTLVRGVRPPVGAADCAALKV